MIDQNMIENIPKQTRFTSWAVQHRYAKLNCISSPLHDDVSRLVGLDGAGWPTPGPGGGATEPGVGVCSSTFFSPESPTTE